MDFSRSEQPRVSDSSADVSRRFRSFLTSPVPGTWITGDSCGGPSPVQIRSFTSAPAAAFNNNAGGSTVRSLICVERHVFRYAPVNCVNRPYIPRADHERRRGGGRGREGESESRFITEKVRPGCARPSCVGKSNRLPVAPLLLGSREGRVNPGQLSFDKQ